MHFQRLISWTSYFVIFDKLFFHIQYFLKGCSFDIISWLEKSNKSPHSLEKRKNFFSLKSYYVVLFRNSYCVKRCFYCGGGQHEHIIYITIKSYPLRCLRFGVWLGSARSTQVWDLWRGMPGSLLDEGKYICTILHYGDFTKNMLRYVLKRFRSLRNSVSNANNI